MFFKKFNFASHFFIWKQHQQKVSGLRSWNEINVCVLLIYKFTYKRQSLSTLEKISHEVAESYITVYNKITFLHFRKQFCSMVGIIWYLIFLREFKSHLGLFFTTKIFTNHFRTEIEKYS